MPGSRHGRLWLYPYEQTLFIVRWTTVAGVPASTMFHTREEAAAFVAGRHAQGNRVRVYEAEVRGLTELEADGGVLGDSRWVWEDDPDAASVGSRDGSPVEGLPDPPADPAHEVRAERLPTPSFVTR